MGSLLQPEAKRASKEYHQSSDPSPLEIPLACLHNCARPNGPLSPVPRTVASLGVNLEHFHPRLLSAMIAETRTSFRMSFSSSILARNLGHSRRLLVRRLTDAMEQCRKRCMIGCTSSRRIFFYTKNPGVVGMAFNAGGLC